MDTQWWISISLGLALGARHALEPDHLVAVGTLMRGDARTGRLVRLGALWGAGHFSTLALGVGILAALRVSLTAGQIALFEAPVGAMLVGLGVLAFNRPPITVIANNASSTAQNKNINASLPAWWSYLVGSVHGLAGTGALVIFVAATFTDLSLAVQYVTVFGVGTMIGMAMVTGILARPLLALQRRPRLYRLVSNGAGALSVLLGLIICADVLATFTMR